jgi:integrase
VLRIVNTLSGILTLAKRHQLIAFNPVDAVEKPPAKRQRDPYPLTLAEVRRLADAAPSADVRNLILAAAFTGARIGELFGLRWQNVKLEPGGRETALIIEQAYQGEVVDRPKTPTGRRQIELGPHAAEALRAQHVESSRVNPLGLVFPSAEGTHQRQSNFTRREWLTTREKAKLPDVTFHDLRHFFVSHIRNAGLPTSVTEQLVGHSDERTHRGYTHALPGTEQMIRDALASAFEDE